MSVCVALAACFIKFVSLRQTRSVHLTSQIPLTLLTAGFSNGPDACFHVEKVLFQHDVPSFGRSKLKRTRFFGRSLFIKGTRIAVTS